MTPGDNANSCPHCKADPCLPCWRKLFLGPRSTARCRTCGYRVGVDIARALLAELPAWLWIFTVVLIIVFTGRWRVLATFFPVVLLSGLVWRFLLYAFEVPLLPDELTSPSMVEAGRARIAAQKRVSRKQEN